MGLPHPEVGLVLNYAYLWRREHRVDREESSKYRRTVAQARDAFVAFYRAHRAVPVDRT